MTKPNPNNKIIRQNLQRRRFSGRKPITSQVSKVNGSTHKDLIKCENNLGLDGKKFKSGG